MHNGKLRIRLFFSDDTVTLQGRSLVRWTNQIEAEEIITTCMDEEGGQRRVAAFSEAFRQHLK